MAAGTAGAQPARLVQSRGTRQSATVPLIGATAPNLHDLGNVSFTDIIEADYTYATPTAAQAAILSLRSAALSATGTLIYGTGATATTIGPALCTAADLIEWTGCGITMRYEILTTEA